MEKWLFKMRKLKKQWLSLLLAAITVICLFQTTAFAAVCILRRRTDTGAFAGGHSAALADIDFFCLSGYFSFNNDIVVLRYPFKHGVG